MKDTKQNFGNTLAEWDLGVTAASIMTDCEKFGMTFGCQEDCPQLERGECEIYKTVEDFINENKGN